MRQILFLVICLASFSFGSFAQTPETFDIATFQPPKGWQRQAKDGSILFVTEDKARNIFCFITLFRSTPGPGNSKQNFDAGWQTLVKDTVGAAEPQMLPTSKDNGRDGWEAQSGYAVFEKEGIKGVAMLFNISGFERAVNILVITNTQVFEQEATAFVESINLKQPILDAPKPASNSPLTSPVANVNASINGTWGKSAGAHMTYGDPVAAGMAGYSKDQYTFNADGTYGYVSKTFRMSYDKILLIRETGTYQVSGSNITISPQRSIIQAWSKQNGVDEWGRLLTTQNRPLEKVTYQFTRHYFSGIQVWNLVLQAQRPTERDGPFSNNTLFSNAWYFSPLSSSNPVIELPR